MDTLVMVVPDQSATIDDLLPCFAESEVRGVISGLVLTLSAGEHRGFLILVLPEDYEANGISLADWAGIDVAGQHSVFSFDYRDPGFAADVIRSLDRAWHVLVENAAGDVRAGAWVTPEFLTTPI